MASVVRNLVGKATGQTQRTISVPLEFGTDHGHQIFVYQHIRTHQIVYSLTRSMNNTLALRQLTFVGKKSVPPSLRKDHWTPLCVLSFPHAHQGLHAYARLREYKHLHEVSWSPSSFTKTSGPGAGHQLLAFPERRKKLMDQKANSIADMAAVLASQARAPTKEEVRKKALLVRTDGRPMAKKGAGSRRSHNLLEWQGRIEGTSVWWADMYDAEFAETWPRSVLHGRLAVNRGTAVWPPPEELVRREVDVEDAAKDLGEEELVERELEKRREVLRRGSRSGSEEADVDVDAKEKVRRAEMLAEEAERKVEAGKEQGTERGWFESTRRLFPGLVEKRVQQGVSA